MDLFTLIKRDHEELTNLLQQLIAKPDPDRESVRDLQDAMADLLVTHSRMEEQFLYSRLQNIPPARELIRHSYEEHSRAAQTLQEIQRHHMDSDFWVELCQNLLAELRPHMQVEERQLFPIIRGELEDSEIDQIYQQMMNFRKENMIVTPEQSV